MNISNNKCIAIKKNGLHCTCPRKHNSNYCGRHIKNINDKTISKETSIKTKINSNINIQIDKGIIDLNARNKLKYNNVKIKELKDTLNYYNINNIGNKKDLFNKVINLFDTILPYHPYLNKIQKLQKNYRNYLTYKILKLQGLTKYLIKDCVNSNDVLTFDNLIDIPREYIFIYKDANDNNFIYGFDIRSFNLIKSSDNPYNRKKIESQVINSFNELIRLLELRGTSLEVESHVETDPNLVVKRKTIKLFQIMDNLDQYTDPKWFLELSTNCLKRLYKELEDIWNYRLELTETTKSKIVPPDGKVFELSVKSVYNINNKVKLQHICLTVIEKLITSSSVREDSISGCIYALLGFVIVNKHAADSLPSYHSIVSGQPEPSIYDTY